MLCFNWASKALKTASKPPSPISWVPYSPLQRGVFHRPSTVFSGHSPLTYYHHLLPPILPTPRSPWATIKTVRELPHSSPCSIFFSPACCATGLVFGYFADHWWPPTTTHHLRWPPPTTGYHYQVLPSPTSALWSFKRGIKILPWPWNSLSLRGWFSWLLLIGSK